MRYVKPPPKKPERPNDRAKDIQRQQNCEDERLSEDAGYGRGTNTPDKSTAS